LQSSVSEMFLQNENDSPGSISTKPGRYEPNDLGLLETHHGLALNLFRLDGRSATGYLQKDGWGARL
jgi:hypothetical protein